MKKKIPISIIRHQDLWNSVILVILYLFQLIIFYITTNLYKSILNKLNELSHSFPPNFFRRIRYHLPAHISFPSNIDNSSLRFMKQCYFSHIISISAHNHLYNYLFIIGKSIFYIVCLTRVVHFIGVEVALASIAGLKDKVADYYFT